MPTSIPSGVKAQELSIVDALWTLIQGQTKYVRKALVKRLLEDAPKTKTQQAMIKESLTQAFDELYSNQIKHDARALFPKSDS